MVLPVATRRPRRGVATRLLAGALLLQLGAAALTVGLLQDEPAAPPAVTATRARAVPPLPAPAPVDSRAAALAERASSVRRTLEQRAQALLERDRSAFLASVHPDAQALRERQSALFDALAQVPLGTWTYTLDSTREPRPDARLDRRYGTGQWWAPGVQLHYALAGIDPRPVVVDHHLTFARAGQRWLLAADDDFALQGRVTPRALWDRGPVLAVRTGGVLVLGRPAQRDLLEEVATLTAAAVPKVTRVWGPWSGAVAVLVPASAQEMSGLLGGGTDLSQIAAVATAELRGGADGYDPTGDRVVVNPDTFGGLGGLGRRVVLTHEVTHVATRRASGPALPSWLAEGFADFVGYRDVDVPVAVSARRLAREVRAGRLPAALPADEDFDGSNPRLSLAYEGAWLAVRTLVDQHGEDGLLRLYRSVGGSRAAVPAQALEQGLAEELGTTSADLTADWRSALSRQLG